MRSRSKRRFPTAPSSSPFTSRSGSAMIPGEIIVAAGEIELNAGRATVTLTVANTGDRPIQAGSHYHFYETNRALAFDRDKARGCRLDIPAGTAGRSRPRPTPARWPGCLSPAAPPVRVAGHNNRHPPCRRPRRPRPTAPTSAPPPAGGVASYMHLTAPQQPEDALYSGITTMLGGGSGPASGTLATTCTGPWHLERMLQAAEGIPVNLGFFGKGNASDEKPLIEMIEAAACALKLHEDWGTTPN